MKVSLNHIRYCRDKYNWSGDPAPDGIDALVQKIGAQLGAVEEVEDLGAKYKGIIIAKVVSCVDHPDSDHLHVCMIDDGGKAEGVERDANGYVQVVCGANNLYEGMMVAWLPPGSTVPESISKDPFVLGTRELRGVVSNGMLASMRELMLGDDHSGIVDIDAESVKPGDDFAVAYGLDDYILDIENKMFTHRPDCFGIMGVAREIAGIQGQKFTSPDWYTLNPTIEAPSTDSLKLTVRNELPELVPRFTAIAVSNVAIKPSPLWLQISLLRLGVRPINNIVDVTNYYMLLTGQPLHAYDYDKVRALDGDDGAALVVRYPRAGETIELLNGKTITPRAEAIMIATESKLIGVGGVMGGAETEVGNDTKNIILECATFDMYSVRRTSMANGLFTDAVTRFNKGQSPLQNAAVIAQALHDVLWLAGGKTASQLVDQTQVAGREWVHEPVTVTTQFINERLGFKLSADEMKQLLENVEFRVSINGDELTAAAPFWRTDIESREDVVEEVGRLYGFDKLPLELPKRTIAPVAKNTTLELKSLVRSTLAKAGANEVLTYSFVHGDLLRKVGQDPDKAFQIGNALSPDLQYYRMSLAPSLLDKIHPNVKAGYHEFALFEIGKAHDLQHAAGEDGLPEEFEMVNLVYARSEKVPKQGAAYYEARMFMIRLLNELGLRVDLESFDGDDDTQATKPFDLERSARVVVRETRRVLGIIGEFKASVRRSLKLPTHTAGFGLSLAALQEAAKNPTIQWYRPLPKFPKVTQDITLKVPTETLFLPLYNCLAGELTKLRPEQTHINLGVGDTFQREDDTAHKQITFHLEISSYEKTMTDAEVNKLLDAAAAAARDTFKAERV